MLIAKFASLLAKVIPIVAAMLAVLRILRWNPPPKLVRVIAWATPAVLVLMAFWTIQSPQDFDTFYYSGQDVLAGRDPYANAIPAGKAYRMPTLSAPPAMPLYVVFALLPQRESAAVWMLLNIAAVTGLVAFARLTLNASAGEDQSAIEPGDTAGLMASLALSTGVREGLCWGQIHILAAWLLMAALYARAKGRPALAGLFLGLASMKPQTLLPFLLIFRRKTDRLAWPTMMLTSLALFVGSTPPGQWVHRVQSWQALVTANFIVGGVNDYSYATRWGTYSLVSLSHALYGVGLRDRQVISMAQLVLVVGIGLGILVDFLKHKDRREDALAALVACYSMIFIYHRHYDGAILALPLVYATARARKLKGRDRLPFVVAALAMIVAINPYAGVMEKVYLLSMRLGTLGGVIRAVTLPLPTWGCLVALFSLWYGIRQGRPLPHGASSHG